MLVKISQYAKQRAVIISTLIHAIQIYNTNVYTEPPACLTNSVARPLNWRLSATPGIRHAFQVSGQTGTTFVGVSVY